ncbi:hypothetical protein CPB83DRAFT_55840 [Crepidotus variabilis]|uniref:ATP-grasp domain-containing protein n=1 Tax=Crepidotus variabilis TaxID=179855 RepID=A0A9P6EMZ1_9AGAR|nr:hypothetical protein CPB83DRAFT_55840 [Crepidotus variabilis]
MTEIHIERPLKLAFTYDRYSDWIEEGLAPEECKEFQEDDTIDALAEALRKLGSVEMVGGIKALTRRLAISKPDWDLVFNFSEGYGSISREAQVPSLLESHGIPFTFSDSATMTLCMDKAKAKMVCEHYKIPTPPFVSIAPRISWPRSGFDPLSVFDDAIHAEALKSFPLFVKPATISTGIGIGQVNKVKSREELAKAIEDISTQHPKDALLIECFLPGREFTVGILGRGDDARVVGVRELVFISEGGLPPNADYVIDDSDPYFKQDVYGVGNKLGLDTKHPNPWPRDLDTSDPDAKAVGETALKAWKVLGCRDAGRVDIRQDNKDSSKAVPNFIEVNTLAGMIPNLSDFVRLAKERGIEYDQLVGMIVREALERYQ